MVLGWVSVAGQRQSQASRHGTASESQTTSDDVGSELQWHATDYNESVCRNGWFTPADGARRPRLARYPTKTLCRHLAENFIWMLRKPLP